MNKPYLIQRMILRRDVPKNPSLDNLYEMGSSEFEWGALPKSLKYFTKNFDKLKLVPSEFRNYKNHMIIMIGLPGDIKEYEKYIPDLVTDKIQLKERTNFKEAISGEVYGKKYDETRHTSAWWDVDNHVMMVFGLKKAIALRDSIGVVREKKIADRKKDWY